MPLPESATMQVRFPNGTCRIAHGALIYFVAIITGATDDARF